MTSILQCLILLLSLLDHRFVVSILQLLVEFTLRETSSALAAVLAFTTPWWHTINEPGGMWNKFCWGAKFVVVTWRERIRSAISVR